MPLQLIITADGSHSLLNTELNETYHSVHGAVRESLHVFIQSGLQFLIDKQNPTKIKLLEVGFGTGLNALLTLHHIFKSTLEIHYVSIEAFPIDLNIANQFNYPLDIDFEEAKELFATIHSCAWNKPVTILPNFILEKRQTTLQEINLSSEEFDLVYFDAFAPNKQPEMWELPIIIKIANAMKSQAVFVTYCAKGQLKRDLKSVGLTVETLPGPLGKREMLRAVKL
jgi:tRNA U34 5-methylaminomethyl-2-thiouridine-forming methyltransferase MnmC